MSTGMTYQIEFSNSGATYDFGEQLGRLCKGGEVFVLSSDLGGGKTTLAKGLVKGLGSSDAVTSPSYTICQEYKGRGGLLIYHFDFYRLSEPGIVGMELAEVIDEPGTVIIIEWGDIVESALPGRRVLIRLAGEVKHQDKRMAYIHIPDGARHLAEALL